MIAKEKYIQLGMELNPYLESFYSTIDTYQDAEMLQIELKGNKARCKRS